MLKRFLLLAIMVSTATTMLAQDGSRPRRSERTIALWGHVKNSLTRVGIPDVFITLMRDDSTVVDTCHVFDQTWQHGPGAKADYAYRFNIPAREQRYIIRAEHPDYETTYVDYHVQYIQRNTYFDAPWHYMKKRPTPDPSHEGGEGLRDASTLHEVTVRATKVKMVYRGDTITFNADAFNLPEGSMLDALISQMDGVELKEDGRIFVQGEQVEELLLNGKDFFKGNNRVMLDNLPAYTVENVQTYHKTSDLTVYMGIPIENKKFVMDVHLKREYNQGWLGNVEVAGGPSFKSSIDDRYLTRFFIMRYTDNSRLSVFGNRNNVNENRKPGTDGDWSPDKTPTGEQENRMAGIDLLIDERDKRWREHGYATLRWRDNNETWQQNSEQFHTDAPNTYHRFSTATHNRSLSLEASNNFELKKPFFLYNNTGVSYSQGDYDARSRSAQFNSDPARYGSTTALMDSVFASALNTDLQQQLINSSLYRSESSNDGTHLYSNTSVNYKLPTGDGIGVELNLSHDHEHKHSNTTNETRYQLTPTLNSILARHGNTPANTNYAAIAPYYRITWPSGFYIFAEYRFLYRQRENTNDLFLADTLDLQNAYDRTHRRVENRLAITPGYSFDRDGKYFRAYYQMHFYNVNEQLDYRSAYADTSLVQHCWTMSPELHIQYAIDNWAKSFDFFYGIEFQTPDLFQKVNILNNEDPLIRRYGNPDLRGATNHRMQFGLNRNWREKRISHRIGGGLRFFRHQVSLGQTYDPTTGIYIYRPENVEGNWQTYFFDFYSMPLDRPRRLMLNNYMHGDYSRNVDIANGLTHTNNYYIENRLTLNYTIGNMTLGLPTYIEYRHTTNNEGTITPINATYFSYGLTANYNFKKSDSRANGIPVWAEPSALPHWLQGVSIATDLKMYSRRGYGDTSMNRDELVWNASISRSFPNPFGQRTGGTLTARLEGFDILSQLSVGHVVINGQGRTETYFNTLPRYMMLHLTYNFTKQPKRR